MPRHMLYAYVDGSDLEGVADVFQDRLDWLVTVGTWAYRRPSVVNQRHERGTSAGNNFPDWNLGLNVELPDPGFEPPNWFADVEQIARFLGELHAGSGREFVIGVYDREHGCSEDLCFIDCAVPDLSELRRTIGVVKGRPY